MISDYQRLSQLQEEAVNSSGASNKQFEKTLDSLETKLQNLRNQVDTFLTQIMDSSFLKFLIDIGKALTEFANKLTKLPGILGSISKIALGIGIFKGGGKLVDKIFGVISGREKISDIGKSWSQKFKNGFFKGMSTTQNISSMGFKNFFAGINANISTFFKGSPFYNEYSTQIDFLNKKLAAGIITQKQYNMEIALLGGSAATGSVGIELYNFAIDSGLTPLQATTLAHSKNADAILKEAYAAKDAATSNEILNKAYRKNSGMGFRQKGSNWLTALFSKDSAARTNALEKLGRLSNGKGSGFSKFLAKGFGKNGQFGAGSVGLTVGGLIGAAVSTTVGLYKEMKQQQEDYANSVADTSERISNVKTEIENITNNKKDLKNLNKEFKNLAKGSSEWNQKLLEINSKILDITKNNKDMWQYVSIDETTNLMSISESGWNEYLAKQQEALKTWQEISAYQQAKSILETSKEEVEGLDKNEEKYEERKRNIENSALYNANKALATTIGNNLTSNKNFNAAATQYMTNKTDNADEIQKNAEEYLKDVDFDSWKVAAGSFAGAAAAGIAFGAAGGTVFGPVGMAVGALGGAIVGGAVALVEHIATEQNKKAVRQDWVKLGLGSVEGDKLYDTAGKEVDIVLAAQQVAVAKATKDYREKMIKITDSLQLLATNTSQELADAVAKAYTGTITEKEYQLVMDNTEIWEGYLQEIEDFNEKVKEVAEESIAKLKDPTITDSIKNASDEIKKDFSEFVQWIKSNQVFGQNYNAITQEALGSIFLASEQEGMTKPLEEAFIGLGQTLSKNGQKILNNQIETMTNPKSAKEWDNVFSALRDAGEATENFEASIIKATGAINDFTPSELKGRVDSQAATLKLLREKETNTFTEDEYNQIIATKGLENTSKDFLWTGTEYILVKPIEELTKKIENNITSINNATSALEASDAVLKSGYWSKRGPATSDNYYGDISSSNINQKEVGIGGIGGKSVYEILSSLAGGNSVYSVSDNNSNTEYGQISRQDAIDIINSIFGEEIANDSMSGETLTNYLKQAFGIISYESSDEYKKQIEETLRRTNEATYSTDSLTRQKIYGTGTSGEKQTAQDVAEQKIQSEKLNTELIRTENAFRKVNPQLAENRDLMKEATIASGQMNQKFENLRSVIEENEDALSDINSADYNKAIDNITSSLQNIFGKDTINAQWVMNNLSTIISYYKGSEGAAKTLLKTLIQTKLASNDVINDQNLNVDLLTQMFDNMTISSDGIVKFANDTDKIMSQWLGNNTVRIQAFSNLLSGLGFSTAYTFDKNGRISGMAVQSNLLKNVKNFRSSYNNKSSSSQWENSYDWLYNLTQKINEELRIREKLEKRYDRILKDRKSNEKDVIAAREKELQSLMKELDLQTEMYEKRRGEISAILRDNKDLIKYATYDFNNNMVQIDWNRINKVKDEKLGGRIEKFIEKLENAENEFESAFDAIEDIYDTVQDIYDDSRQNYLDFENRVLEAVVKQYQLEIDRLTEIDSSINDSNSKLLDSIQKSINAQRQARQNAETEETLNDKLNQLMYKRQDATSSLTELKSLEKELEDSRQDYINTLVDQKISELQEQNDEAAEQRQRQIELMEGQLEQAQKQGLLWDEVNLLIKEGVYDSEGNINKNSRLVQILKDLDDYNGLSQEGKKKWEEELDIQYKQYEEFGAIKNLLSENLNTIGSKLNNLSNSLSNVAANINAAINSAADRIISALGGGGGDGDTQTKATPQKDKLGNNIVKPNINPITGLPREGTITDTNNEKGSTKVSPQKTVKPIEPLPTEIHGNKEVYKPAFGESIKEKIFTNLPYQMEKIAFSNAGSGWVAIQILGDPLKYLIKTKNEENAYNFIKDFKDLKDKVIYGKPPFETKNLLNQLKNKWNIKDKPIWLEKPKFATGGLADFTGPAWLDGTKSRPELVLNPRDTENFIQLKDILSSIMSNNIPTITEGARTANSNFEININVDSISSDYDVDRLVERVKKDIVEDSSYRNPVVLNLLR